MYEKFSHSMLSPSKLVQELPGLINAHAHGTYGPQYRGVKASAPFDLSGVNLMARETHEPRPEEFFACALVTGYENLRFGTTALLDHYYGPLTHTHVHAVAEAYERVGIRAWVLVELTDLPWLLYPSESYPRFPGSVPAETLPDDLRALVETQPTASLDDVETVADIIGVWSGHRVRIGLALGNPLWCSDELIRRVATAAQELGVLLTTHVEESALQREVSLAEWGLSGVERLWHAGALSRQMILSHAVHISADDMRLLAESGATISHNPLSNLKLQTGMAPVGDWVRAGVNVCLGCDGQSSGDSQNLFSVMKTAAALADLNGLRSAVPSPEEAVLEMATANAAHLWPADNLAGDVVEFTESLGPYAHAWDEPAAYIREVVVEGAPRLAAARELVEETRANELVLGLREAAVATAQVERAERLTSELRQILDGRSNGATRAGPGSVIGM
ncbi:MAG TPA: amidohydrolase family protein [Gaiellaceae bacterium]|nr:amidohydrolase family protein [Gaiellaceae bacterium]